MFQNSALTRFIRAYVLFYLRGTGVGYLIILVYSGVENSITTLGVEISMWSLDLFRIVSVLAGRGGGVEGFDWHIITFICMFIVDRMGV